MVWTKRDLAAIRAALKNDSRRPELATRPDYTVTFLVARDGSAANRHYLAKSGLLLFTSTPERFKRWKRRSSAQRALALLMPHFPRARVVESSR